MSGAEWRPSSSLTTKSWWLPRLMRSSRSFAQPRQDRHKRLALPRAPALCVTTPTRGARPTSRRSWFARLGGAAPHERAHLDHRRGRLVGSHLADALAAAGHEVVL